LDTQTEPAVITEQLHAPGLGITPRPAAILHFPGHFHLQGGLEPQLQHSSRRNGRTDLLL